MRPWKKLLSLTAACALSVSLLAGCSGTTTPAAEPAASGSGNTTATEGKMFNIALTAPFTGFDPLRTNDSASTYVNAQIYETLYRIDPESDEYMPLLAAEMPQYSEDGLTVTVKLREGVTFHDGTPFNAEAVKYTFDLIKDPEFGSARASIAGSIDTMECPDDYTIVFHLLYEDGVFTAKLAHTNSAIVSPTAQQSQDLMVNPCGTGPYKFVSSVSGSNVVLTRNEDYWGELPAIKDVTMTIIADESNHTALCFRGRELQFPFLPLHICLPAPSALDDSRTWHGEVERLREGYPKRVFASAFELPAFSALASLVFQNQGLQVF